MNYLKSVVSTVLLSAASTFLMAQQVPSPKSHFGFAIGDDYKLTNYAQTEAYFKKVAASSDRVKMELAGTTSEGRNQYLLIVSSPENLKNVDRFKEISQKMARAEMSYEEAKALSLEGKPVIWIDGGLHSTETVAVNQLMETLYALSSRNDAETLRILDEVIILLFHCNPDGHDIVGDWYMQYSEEEQRNKTIPILYHKYAGHDNNRDFYMNSLVETATISRLQYIEWNPQVIYNHHQSSPPGTLLAGPPYRDPFNFVIDPMLITGIDAIGAAMINRANKDGFPGYTRLDGAVFSTWWNGGLRTAPYFHNSIGILTEITGDPTPMEIPVVTERLIPTNATPNPVIPQAWHFRSAIEYSVSLNYAILDYASRFGDELLYNMFLMGKKSIDRGSKDYWPAKPSYVAKIDSLFERDQQKNAAAPAEEGYYGMRRNISKSYYDAVFSDPALRDPHGYIISADQTDFPRAIDFLNALIKSGIEVHKAKEAFSVEAHTYPAGSYVVKTAQAFRPHVLDMFDPQDHPNDLEYPGGPPVKPYDAAGWTLAYQFGIDFDRILAPFDGPFERLPYGQLQLPPSTEVPASSKGYWLDSRVNNSFVVVNSMLAQGAKIKRTEVAVDDVPAGSFFIPAKYSTTLTASIAQLGVQPVPARSVPNDVVDVTPARVALFDQYGGSMPSGWVRWILEQYKFDHVSVVYPTDIDTGGLREKYDVLLFVGSGIPGVGAGRSAYRGPRIDPALVPQKYQHMLGSLTAEKSIPVLQQFMDDGGVVFTIGASTALAYHLGLPVENLLTETNDQGRVVPLSGSKFYAPGSIHQVYADTTAQISWGMPSLVDVMSSNSPVFSFTEQASAAGLHKIAWYGEQNPLRSGWIWGSDYLKNGVVAFSAPVGKGMLYAFGPEITFRSQPHGTFKWLFNTLYTTK